MTRLLSESYLNSLPDPIAKNMEALNQYVVERICKRLQKIGEMIAPNPEMVNQYADADIRAIEKELEKSNESSREEAEKMYLLLAGEVLAFASAFYKAKGMDPPEDYTKDPVLKSMVDQAVRNGRSLVNLSGTEMIGFVKKQGNRTVFVPLREYYIQTINKAIMAAKDGTVDYYTAMRSTIKELAKSGVRQYEGYKVTFASGYSRRIDTQVRMNLLDGVRQLNMAMLEQTGKEFGADGVEISAHALCAPDHQRIQGKQYSLAEFERLNRSLERPIGTLNCHHFTTPIILGVSKPVYSRSELAEINRRSNQRIEYKTTDRKGNAVTEKMTRYEASQRQRQLETAIRYAKDERDACVAAGDKLGATQARKKSAALTAEYKRFSEAAGLTKRMERTR